MRLRILLLPATLLAALAFVAPPEAQASPHGRRHGRALHQGHGRHLHHGHGRRLHARRGGAFVGGAVTIPIRQRGGYYREVVEVVGGYYETRAREVEVPGRQIGFDRHGHPIYAGSRVVLEHYEVWVPRRRIVRQVWVPARPVGVVTIGARVRIR